MDFAHDELPLDAAQPIDEQRPVKMIHFMLKRTCKQLASLNRVFVAGSIEASNDSAGGADDRGVEAWQAEAPLFFELHAFTLDEDGIDHDDEIRGVAAKREIDDEEADGNTDLCRGKANTWRRVHRFHHVVHQPLDAVVNDGDIGRALVEERLPIAQDRPDHKCGDKPIVRSA